MRRVAGSILLTALCVVAQGCGASGVLVDGKLVDGGAPYTLSEGEGISLTLASEDGKTSCGANVENDGTFQVKTTTGQPVPPGKYQVSIIHYRPVAGKGTPTPPAPLDTGEVWDVSSSNRSFTLDLAKLKDKEKPKGKDKK